MSKKIESLEGQYHVMRGRIGWVGEVKKHVSFFTKKEVEKRKIMVAGARDCREGDTAYFTLWGDKALANWEEGDMVEVIFSLAAYETHGPNEEKRGTCLVCRDIKKTSDDGCDVNK